MDSRNGPWRRQIRMPRVGTANALSPAPVFGQRTDEALPPRGRLAEYYVGKSAGLAGLIPNT